MLRCDKLDRDEIKNLLMCFLHILKSMSEGRAACLSRCAWSRHIADMKNRSTVILSKDFLPYLLTPEALFAYWNKAAPSDLMDFFTLIE